ncbi:ribosome small subunit-dependent GTPase A [Heliophilum fasciatum]|uniref:Small ribosomal subunit biogenesis GTPase RsgA n=1 Tax=Heliophilum fasciatum TaxID=35700 RepID=A0A4R2RFG9_9FIRM|nr:ribosome small subunit-dependent GTPase A [Heliophilum fasciatum]MCW2279133.1 ribosome biogenesis GTPase [Heliophilum fasciatum]TCP61218.1 ribosome biogenesis GTPase [Heliophilum fasciatum]
MFSFENDGANHHFVQEAKLYPNLFIGRVCSQYKDLYKVLTEQGEVLAEISGKYRYEVADLPDYPAVGDYVMLDRTSDEKGKAIIHHLLSRKSVFERKAAGTKDDVQVVAANIDTIFICMSLNNDYNLRRLERYLSIAWNSRAIPVILLTKVDLCTRIEEKLAEVAAVAIGVEVILSSGILKSGMESIKHHIQPGKTVAFIGSSGVGKSTLINCLIGEERLAINEISKNEKGRHTTTKRELIVLPNGGMVIDTPGMRELGIESSHISRAFTDIDELTQLCKFRDCSHQTEPGCAVRQAIEQGKLSEERLLNYLKLKKEAKYDGLDAKQIEIEKMNTMFAGMGGVKNARKFIKEQSKRKHT